MAYSLEIEVGRNTSPAEMDPTANAPMISVLKGMLASLVGNAQLLSGVVTVAAAGTAEPCPDVDGNEFILKALAANTGIVYIGNDGADDVASTTGYPLEPGEAVPVCCSNLSQVWVDSAVNGEGVAYLRIR